jgi:transposase
VTGQLIGEEDLPMGWTETCAVEERMRFMLAVERQEEPFAALCRQFGVSRKTGYKWLERYEAAGVDGLIDRSRAPHDHPQAIGETIAERCLEVRRAHPSWGPVKVRAYLERSDAAIAWPAVSTIGTLFDREGLTVKRRLRRRSPPSSAPFADCNGANDVWCIDFKGWFLTGDGTHCEPLTLRMRPAAIYCAARPWAAAMPNMSGRFWTRHFASSACRIGCAPTMVRRLRRAARVACRSCPSR